MAKYEFAIKKDVLNSGEIIYTPVCRRKLTLGRFFPSQWERITRIYDKYILMELHWNPFLTYEECEEHIRGYQEELSKQIQNQVQTVEFHVLEEVDY